MRETLEHYTEEVANTFTAVDYRPTERMFLARAEATTMLRSYLNDVRTTYNSARQSHDPEPARQE